MPTQHIPGMPLIREAGNFGGAALYFTVTLTSLLMGLLTVYRYH